jgi:tRNA pseudouridine13 synthase
VYKARWEDFEVAEIPSIEPEGAGEHLWMEVEKRGLTTARAAGDLARALGVKPSSVGYAGMKDARAVARQWMSVEHVEPERALALEIPRIRVLRAVRHPRKLRRGWHAGNRFAIRLRELHPAAAPDRGDARPTTTPAVGYVGEWAERAERRARAVLEELERLGVPNYYGPQRFGTRGDTWRVGRALAREEWSEAAALIAGRPLRPGDPAVDESAGVRADRGDVLRARELYDAGEYAAAAEAWPRGFGQCARLAAAMERTGGDAPRAIRVVGKRMLRLYASAYQSWLYNAVLAERIRGGTMARMLAGDLAWKHDTEALFLVEEPAAEQPRADAFEISPTGPLVGRRMRPPAGRVAELETRVIEEAGLRPEALESRAMRPLTGRRRPLRFALGDVSVAGGADAAGAWLELRFLLPPGCYATAVLRELGKGRIVEAESTAAPER